MIRRAVITKKVFKTCQLKGIKCIEKETLNFSTGLEAYEQTCSYIKKLLSLFNSSIKHRIKLYIITGQFISDTECKIYDLSEKSNKSIHYKKNHNKRHVFFSFYLYLCHILLMISLYFLQH